MNNARQLADDNRLVDLAKVRAGQLRREAVAHFGQDAGHAVLQAAKRFAGSLPRLLRLRKHPGM